MNAFQVGSLLAVWQVLIVVFEIPTGVIADKFGRKYSLSIGKAVRLFCYPMWLFFPNYLGLLAGLLFLSLGDALISGALEAYSYDELPDKQSFNKLRQRTVAIHLAAFTTAGLISYILNADYHLILITSILMSAIGFVASFLLPTDKIHQSHKYLTLLKDSKLEIKKNSNTLYLFITTSAVLALLVIFIEQLNIFYKATGISDVIVALLMTIGNFITFLIFWVSHRIEKLMRDVQALLLILFVSILTLTVVIKLNAFIQIGMVFLFVRIVRLSVINYSNDLHHAISSKTRATVGSISSFFGKILASLTMLAIGYVGAHEIDIKLSISVSGLLISSTIYYLHILQRQSRTLQ